MYFCLFVLLVRFFVSFFLYSVVLCLYWNVVLENGNVMLYSLVLCTETLFCESNVNIVSIVDIE